MLQLLSLDGRPHEVGLTRPDDAYRLILDGVAIPVALEPLGRDRYRLHCDGHASEVRLAIEGDLVHVHLDGTAYALAYTDPVRRYGDSAGAAADDRAVAPMPGVVVMLDTAAGRAVRSGETLLVIESMKLETAIKAWRDGIVAEVHVAAGGTFERGAPLVTLAPAEA